MRRRGFTLVELLVVIGIIALLISILLPALSKARDSAYRAQCASNMRQLNMAYLDYAREYKGRLIYSHTSDPPAADTKNPPGIKPWIYANKTEQGIRDGALFPLLGTQDLRLYRCPADSSLNLRSFSLNSYLNGESYTSPRKFNIAEVPHAPNVFTFLEEYDPRGDNYGSFIVPKSGDKWTDIPGFFHKGCTVAFADGHVEFYPYVDSRTFGLRDIGAETPNNPDLRQFQKWCGLNDPAW